MSHNPNNGNCPKTIVGDCGYEKCNPDVHPCTCPQDCDLAATITQLASEYAEHKHLDKEAFYEAVKRLLK